MNNDTYRDIHCCAFRSHGLQKDQLETFNYSEAVLRLLMLHAWKNGYIKGNTDQHRSSKPEHRILR